MAYWILKSEPEVYSYTDLLRDGSTVWDGVANNTALMHIRTAKPGDSAIIYHTSDERQCIGLAEITSLPYADPRGDDPKLVVFELRPLHALPHPVTLAAIKADPFFANFALVRQSRLSVVPVSDAQWQRLMVMAGA